MRIATLKNAYRYCPSGWGYESNLWEIMGWESSYVVRFELGPLIQGQMRIATPKSAYNWVIIGPSLFSFL